MSAFLSLISRGKLKLLLDSPVMGNIAGLGTITRLEIKKFKLSLAPLKVVFTNHCFFFALICLKIKKSMTKSKYNNTNIRYQVFLNS